MIGTTLDPRYVIEAARPDAVSTLPAIEVAAGRIFSEDDIPAATRDAGLSLDYFERAARERRLWVALLASTREPVGFALAKLVDGSAHLHEVDVLPDHGRRGLGGCLVRTVAEWAGNKGYSTLTLTTFRHLPWNAPFYRRLGFEELAEEELSPELAEHLDAEGNAGLDRSKRTAMRLALSP